ncbi:hypothetical protein [Filifactor alocis]|uniref:hypothetical protein n=1 Tax=Filifactor alocis TaxID=143361 RepID=UPI0028D03373|nr:hypothetical protein [Filifactor alocis]
MKRVMYLFCCFLCIVLLSSCSDGEYDPVTGTYSDYGDGGNYDEEVEILQEKISFLESTIEELESNQQNCLEDWRWIEEQKPDLICDIADYYNIDTDDFFDVYSDYLDEYGDPTETIDEYQKSFDEIMKNYRLWNK